MSRPYFPPPQRAQQIIDSPDVQERLEAGTHRVEVRSKYIDLQLIDGKPVGIPLADPITGKETAKEFRVWKVPKSQRPECGARCRDGSSCKARVTVQPDGAFNTRCRMHGGVCPFVTGEAPVKARIEALAQTREQLFQALLVAPTELQQLIAISVGELDATLEMLESGPEKPKRLPRKPKPVKPSQTLSDEDMGALLLELGVFSNIE